MAALRTGLRLIDVILDPRQDYGLAGSTFPQPYSFHQPLFL